MYSTGKYSYGTPTILWNIDDSKVVCGNFVCIANDVTIFLGNGRGHDSSFVTIYPFGHTNCDIFYNVVNNSRNTNGDVVIGNDVWIGNSSTIMSGVTISDGAIIAANSHIVKDVEPYSIVGGNPAKHIKYRFHPNQIKQLLQIKWWNWSDLKINAYIPLMLSKNIDKFIITALTDNGDYTKA
jgi:acetyltransferase-like isoleucine patch superfamily enzyme